MAAGGFYVPRIKNVYKKNKRCFWVRPVLSKGKILTHTSLPYCSFDSNPCTQQTAEEPHCAETSLQVMKVVMKQKPFDLYRPATGLGRVVENTNSLPKCSINVA